MNFLQKNLFYSKTSEKDILPTRLFYFEFNEMIFYYSQNKLSKGGNLKKGILIRMLRSSERAQHTVSVLPLMHIYG